ncbi:MAG: hypothetical protein Q8T08_05200 [Ignavibacteria bacterium]|nr:hypothetical protein [Ignavibacteria bacterium]
MKKHLLIFIFLLATSIVAFSQSNLDKGESRINFGTGFSNYGIPLYFGMDFGVHQDISAGFVVSGRSDNNVFIMSFAGLGNYHFNRLLDLPSQWDLYAGLSLGFILWNYDDGVNEPSPLALNIQLGGRYYWNENWAINLEFGGGNAFSGTRIGVTRKL